MHLGKILLMLCRRGELERGKWSSQVRGKNFPLLPSSFPPLNPCVTARKSSLTRSLFFPPVTSPFSVVLFLISFSFYPFSSHLSFLSLYASTSTFPSPLPIFSLGFSLSSLSHLFYPFFLLLPSAAFSSTHFLHLPTCRTSRL